MNVKNLCLMAHKKSENSEVYTLDPRVKPSYKQLSKAFSEMHIDALDSLKKIYLQRNLFQNLKRR